MTMPQYLMILHDSTTALASMSPDEMQRVIARYKGWSDKLGAAGKLVGGEKLRDDGGKHLSLNSGKLVVRDGPYAEAKEIIGGFFTIVAADYAEATQLCADCPHLELGGKIELREIEPV
jgi:hypothetical protein